MRLDPTREGRDTDGDGIKDAYEVVGYGALNSLDVKVHDINKIGEIVDKAVAAGINETANLQLLNQNTKTAHDEARRKAVKDAIDKATLLADAAGVKLGRLIELSDPSYEQPSYRRNRFTAVAYDEAEAPLLPEKTTIMFQSTRLSPSINKRERARR